MIFSKPTAMYEKFRHLRGAIVLIEGPIGAGKTTLGNKLKSYLIANGIEAEFFHEYRNDTLLEQYIQNPKKYAYSFQLFMLAKRIAIYERAIALAKTGVVVFIDRSLIGDNSFAYMHYKSGNISQQDYDVYMQVAKMENLIAPSFYIYLDASVSTCMKRINKRGIVSEINGYSEKYLSDLEDAYRHVRSEFKTIEITIAWDSTECDDSACDNILSKCSV